MKKIIFLLASLVAIFTAIANNYMHVYLNNGSILDFDTDSILQVDVLKDSVTNSNYLLVVKNDSSTLRIEKSDIQKITYDDTIYKEEPVTKKDSIWGLEVKASLIEKDEYYVRKNIQGEFYSNIKIENVDYMMCKYYDQYSTMLLNSENFKNKSKNECIMEGDSVYLVKFEWEMTVSSLAKETPFEVILILQDGTESNELLKEVTYISEPEVFVVSFYTKDSVLIESQKVEKGKSATAVDAPVVDGYEFIGWSDSSFTNVTKDLDIYAQYKAITKDTLPVSGQIAEHDYVDLGLPSGTLWATYNVGATTPEEYGDYFAWGETKPKEDYSWSTYKWCENKKVDAIHIPQDFTKYVVSSEYGIVDNKMVLEAEDDAATANWGADWRMPTFDEINELTENCEYSWIEVNGIKGAKFTASNGNFVFFPAAGNRYGSEIECSGQKGYYRSSSLHESYDHCAERIYFNEKGFYKKTISRDEGHSVRAVANIK
ncbi:MAG: InlB B-repeat-containing protein [Paludibacteraceae bacterium]|nr:InlB B-repeat-containing protein [Paludibacteraceae bacterium]